MGFRAIAQNGLKVEREIRRDPPTVWRATTDIYELRTWWGMPVIDLVPEIGGYFDIHQAGGDHLVRFQFTDWRQNCQVAGVWQYSWLEGEISETTSIEPTPRGVRVSIEQTGFETFKGGAGRIVRYHRAELAGRIARLAAWCEHRTPAHYAQMPVY